MFRKDGSGCLNLNGVDEYLPWMMTLEIARICSFELKGGIDIVVVVVFLESEEDIVLAGRFEAFSNVNARVERLVGVEVS